jgi:hypothetical protein
MKKTYEKPVLVKREALETIAAGAINGNGMVGSPVARKDF